MTDTTEDPDDRILDWAHAALVRDVGDLYDNPYWMTADELREQHATLEMVAEWLDANFDHIVTTETRIDEQARVAQMLRAPGATPLSHWPSQA